MKKPRRVPLATGSLPEPRLDTVTGGAGAVKANVISEPAGPDNVR